MSSCLDKIAELCANRFGLFDALGPIVRRRVVRTVCAEMRWASEECGDPSASWSFQGVCGRSLVTRAALAGAVDSFCLSTEALETRNACRELAPDVKVALATLSECLIAFAASKWQTSTDGLEEVGRPDANKSFAALEKADAEARAVLGRAPGGCVPRAATFALERESTVEDVYGAFVETNLALERVRKVVADAARATEAGRRRAGV